MEQVSQITEFGKVFLYLVMGVLFVGFTFFLASLVALKKPNPEKLSSYECGEKPTGNSWIQFNSRFYIIALVFLLFDVEMVFIFPWATVFGDKTLIAADSRWGWLTLIEMFIFIGILLIGLIYVWKKGDLNWLKPINIPPVAPSKIPHQLYDKINSEIYVVKNFTHGLSEELNTQPQPVKSFPQKPMFKANFKKTSE
ncbi:MAG: NADH-quinone oxidoreductase subunit [Sphingobacteriales bacterium]|nr:NADH-quinone oxidoreductase subunit [Sphingobacteriales bacterium]